MYHQFKRLPIFALLIFAWSCGDSGIGDCFIRTGDQAEVVYDLEPFHQIDVFDGMEVYISEGPEYKVTVEAGEHIINHIEVKNEEGVLRLADNISCEWARKYEPKIVRITCPDLRTIYQNGFGNIISEDTLHFDSLEIRPRYGSGNVTLTLDSRYVFVESHRNGTITLSGKTEYLHVALLFYLPVFDGKKLIANRIHINHHCNNDMHLYPLRRLTGSMDMKGNAYLYHTPEEIQVKILGEGKIIDMTTTP